MAQMVERILGKDEVTSSILVSSSKKRQVFSACRFFFLPFSVSALSFTAYSKSVYKTGVILMKKLKVCVIFGGKSEEYSVSLRSAHTVLSAIDKKKYVLTSIGITREGKWYLYGGDIDRLLDDSWAEDTSALFPVTIDIFNEGVSVFNGITTFFKPDIVIPMVHGDFCEDGRLQSVLESASIPYLGCDSYTSFICYNKALTKALASRLGVKVTEDALVIQSDLTSFYKVLSQVSNLKMPLFVKPACGGSSVGASRVNSLSELFPACLNALKYSDFALIEEFISGTECEIGILFDKGELILSEVGSLNYSSDFYDYKTKYSDSSVKYSIPAAVSLESQEKIKEYARLLAVALGLKAPCRLDFFVDKDENVYFNEINTLPGFTKTSMYPMLFQSYGYLLPSLIDALINSAAH